jgi:hypothetical protein
MSSDMKKETLEEFIARGGVVKRIEAQHSDEQKEVVRSTTAKAVQLYELGDAAFYFPENKPPRKRKIKPLDLSGIDMSLIPAHLKAKLNL